jgi:ankyrin repeat protein
VDSLYFHSALEVTSYATEITIGDTEDCEPLNEDENAWNIMETGKHQSLEELEKKVEGSLSSQTSDSVAELEWTERDKLGQRALHLAAERGNEKLVEQLLDRDDHPNAPNEPDDNRQTPLHRAAWGGSLETVIVLRDRGSKADAIDKAGNMALHIAADMGFEKVAKCLCEIAGVQAEGRNGLTPLHYAALSGQYAVAELLVKQGATIDAKDHKFGWTPLHCAAENGQTSVIQLLLENGAKVEETDDKVGWTPLHFAAMNGHKAAVEMLIGGEADMNKKDKNRWTPLHFAAINGHGPVVKELLRRDATIRSDIFDWAPEDVKTYEAVVKWLKTNGNEFGNNISSATWSRLYIAAIDGRIPVIRLVVDNDTDISEEGMKAGDSVLH